MKDNEQLDLLFREALADASEEVPAGAWDAVAAGLGHRHRILPLAARWAGGIAAAAAVVVGFLLFPAHQTPATIQTDTALAAATEIHELSEIPELSELPLLSELLAIPAVPAIPEVTDAIATAAKTIPAGTIAVNAPEAESPASETPSAGTPIADTPAADTPAAGTPAAGTPTTKTRVSQGSVPANMPSFAFRGNMIDTQEALFGTRVHHSAPLDPNIVPEKTSIIETGSSVYSVPLSVGLSAVFPLEGRWAIGTGLNANFLTRSFNGTFYEVNNGQLKSKKSGEIDHLTVYLGIPVNFYYRILDQKRFSLYAYSGGEIEKAIMNRYTIDSRTEQTRWSEKVSGVQLSAGAGIGMSMKCSDYISLYLDPGFKYYFDCKQPRSLRTDKRILINLDLGLRFSL